MLHLILDDCAFGYMLYAKLIRCHRTELISSATLSCMGRPWLGLSVGSFKARYAVLFQIRTFLSRPEDEAHIGPTATYDEVIYPGFQHDITALQIQGYNISYNRHTIA